ncbi:fungal-specific transcription factor domain-containing protein [Trametes punicea]|nr:fungal-specific transcription factor domain-containing protein [Trametes punicea]
MTYSPSHGSYSPYPIRYAFSSQQQQQQQQQHPQQQQQQQQQHHPAQQPPHPQPHQSQQSQVQAAAHPHHAAQHPQTHYPKPSYPHHPHLHHAQIPIKVEESADLPPVSSITGYDHHHHHVKSPPPFPLFRFGTTDFTSSASPTSPSTPFTFMSSHHQTWPSSSSASASSSSYAHHQQHPHPQPQQHHPHAQYAAPAIDRYAIPSPVNGQSDHHHALTLTDEYDDEAGDELGDLPGGVSLSGMGLSPYGAGAGSGAAALSAKAAAEKQIRRRSSKACDQCRKSKCKCERSSPQEPCRNCVMLGTPCTFLGPSRKRGPPKGYIDAIEARLHQTEALIGILLSSRDSRAKSVLQDLAEDPLAKEIITRVDNSPYGYRGRSRGAEAPTSRTRAPPEQRDGDGNTVHATHPSNEWQDKVIERLNELAASQGALLPEDEVAAGPRIIAAPSDELGYPEDENGSRPSTTQTAPPASAPVDDDAQAQQKQAKGQSQPPPPPQQTQPGEARRQRRRLEEVGKQDGAARSPSTTSSRSPQRHTASRAAAAAKEEQSVEESEESGEDEIAVAVGQLSLNEDEQVRFHGKVSGLHMLGVQERSDGRNEGGLWRFPKARVWPPLPPAVRNSRRRREAEEFVPRLPDLATQELLLELYFAYVHPALPIVHKRSFLDDFRNGNMCADSPCSGESGYSDAASPISSSSPLGSRRRRVPTLLLLAMFSLAARYSPRTADMPPPDDGTMWTAGDEYMEDAKVILDRTYAASRPSTCQALLLLGYREVGIGAMAQAWLYVGMAVRMAQDLGLHKSAEKWTSVGRSLFTKAELQERRRIWYGCVVMDKYVCAYIGRPVAICERDFDTELPLEESAEEMEVWRPHPEPPVVEDAAATRRDEVVPAPGRVISCFNESAKLSLILSQICETVYAIKPPTSRPAELARLDRMLTKWSLELPEHLRWDPAAPKTPPPPPHILTLHMQYWCTVLLLHRPFIRFIQDSDKPLSPSASCTKEADVRASSRRHYNICVQAANHITLIVSVYGEYYLPSRASVFPCYYLFTAGIMHVATHGADVDFFRRSAHVPDDPQASLGLQKCMDGLHRMGVTWPSAWRALQLLQGAKAQLAKPTDPPPSRGSVSEPRNKRAAEEPIEEDHGLAGLGVPSADELPGRERERGRSEPEPGEPRPGPSQQSYALQMEMPHGAGPSSYIPSSYDRWPTDSTALSSFGGSLSTSVLPQQYSTGLVDERMSASVSRSSERQSARYPQYWNDYSALSQMETTYGVPVMGEMVPPHGNAPQGDQPSMYVQEQYSMFGEPSSPASSPLGRRELTEARTGNMPPRASNSKEESVGI